MNYYVNITSILAFLHVTKNPVDDETVIHRRPSSNNDDVTNDNTDVKSDCTCVGASDDADIIEFGIIIGEPEIIPSTSYKSIAAG
jgi:hypothetical protein